MPYGEDLRDSRGCLLEAGGQVDDALEAGKVPVLLAGDCSIGITTLPVRPAAPARRSGALARRARRLQHAGHAPPAATSAACPSPAPAASGTPASTDTIASDRVVLAGVRDIDAGEREVLGRSGVTVIGASTVETLVAVKNALDGAPGLRAPRPRRARPGALPGAVPRRPAGCTPRSSTTWPRRWCEDCEMVGLEVTAFEAPDDPAEHAVGGRDRDAGGRALP